MWLAGPSVLGQDTAFVVRMGEIHLDYTHTQTLELYLDSFEDLLFMFCFLFCFFLFFFIVALHTILKLDSSMNQSQSWCEPHVRNWEIEATDSESIQFSS